MTKLKAFLAVTGVVYLVLSTAPASADPVKNIVLVHGAWVDASGWKPVYEILTKQGFHVTMVQEPETRLPTMSPQRSGFSTFRMDLHFSSATAMAVRSSPRPASMPNVVGLSTSPRTPPMSAKTKVTLGAKTPSVLAKTDGAVKKTPDGFTYLDPADFPICSRPICRAERAAFVARSQVLAAGNVFNTPLTAAAWKTKPSWGIVAGSDQIINPDLERWYDIALIGSSVTPRVLASPKSHST